MANWTLAIVAPLLLVIGLAGFVIPASKAMTSGAAPYNISHMSFRALGLGFARACNNLSERGTVQP